MPPRGTTGKRKRQYQHIKQSELEAGRSDDVATEIAARTVNKQRASAGASRSRATAAKRTSGGRKSTAASRKRSSTKRTSAASRTRKKTAGRKK